MITHIDQLLHLLAEGIRRRGYILPDLTTDLQTFNWYLRKWFDIEYRATIPFEDIESKFSRLLERAIKPFALGGNTLALRIDKELAEDFHGAKPPDTSEHMDILANHEAIYIDFPPRAYYFKEGLYLSGIFVMKFEHQVDNPEQIKVLVSFSKHGTSRTISLIYDLGIHDVGVPLPADLDSFAVEEEIENIIKLSLLYYLSKEGPEDILPQLADERIAKIANPKKLRNRLREASLFKVVNLKSPKGRFGRTDQERMPASGWKISVRAKVRGHFRWQPYGPQHSLRRLQWIAGFERGPVDGHQQSVLYRMESKRS